MAPQTSHQPFFSSIWKCSKKGWSSILRLCMAGLRRPSPKPSYRPLPFDPILAPQLAKLGSLEDLLAQMPQKAEDVLTPDLQCEDRVFAGPDNNELAVSIFQRAGSAQPSGRKRIGIYDLHGGGMILGTRFASLSALALDVVRQFDAVCVTVEYRLAPAHPDPAIIEDCYAGLLWMAEHADELGIDPAKILVSGISAGGGLSAGVALLARDRKGPALMGQILMSPMLDDRSNSLSAYQMDGLGIWDRKANIEAWTSVLGNRRGTKHVSMYEAPARSQDLSGLPPAYVDVGSAETFRDEDVQYASKLWKDGISCELHVWPGMCHGFELFFPSLDVSASAKKAKLDWVQRLVVRNELAGTEK